MPLNGGLGSNPVDVRKSNKSRLKILIWFILYCADFGTDFYNGYQLWQDCHFPEALIVFTCMTLPGIFYGIESIVQAIKHKDCLKFCYGIVAPFGFAPWAICEMLANFIISPTEESMDDLRL